MDHVPTSTWGPPLLVALTLTCPFQSASHTLSLIHAIQTWILLLVVLTRWKIYPSMFFFFKWAIFIIYIKIHKKKHILSISKTKEYQTQLITEKTTQFTNEYIFFCTRQIYTNKKNLKTLNQRRQNKNKNLS